MQFGVGDPEVGAQPVHGVLAVVLHPDCMTSASLGVITPPAMPVPTTSPGSSGSTTLAITTRSAAAEHVETGAQRRLGARRTVGAYQDRAWHRAILARAGTADHRRGPSVAQTTRRRRDGWR